MTALTFAATRSPSYPNTTLADATPAEPFQRLTSAVVEQFPGCRPYGGVYAEVVPHLTVGEARWATRADLVAAEADISPMLPITARIERALLIAGTDQADSWRTLAGLPFATEAGRRRHRGGRGAAGTMS